VHSIRELRPYLPKESTHLEYAFFLEIHESLSEGEVALSRSNPLSAAIPISG
jgi:hypothetical protein